MPLCRRAIFAFLIHCLLLAACRKPIRQQINSPGIVRERMNDPEKNKPDSKMRRLVVRKAPIAGDDWFTFDSTLEGTLSVIDGCVVVIPSKGRRWTIPVWPSGTEISVGEDSVRTKINGRVRTFEFNADFFVGGGLVSREVVENIAELKSCYGRYFLVGDIDS